MLHEIPNATINRGGKNVQQLVWDRPGRAWVRCIQSLRSLARWHSCATQEEGPFWEFHRGLNDKRICIYSSRPDYSLSYLMRVQCFLGPVSPGQRRLSIMDARVSIFAGFLRRVLNPSFDFGYPPPPFYLWQVLKPVKQLSRARCRPNNLFHTDYDTDLLCSLESHHASLTRPKENVNATQY